MLQTQTRFLTIVELISRRLEWDDVQNCPTRDYLNIEIPSDSPLTVAEVNQSVKKYSDYMVGGVTEIDLSTAPDEF